MNYINNYLQINGKSQIGNLKQSTSQEPVKATQAQSVNVSELPAVAPDYNVKVPMAYTRLDDIKLSDDVVAQCYRLANGQKVVIVPKEGDTVVKTYVNTGSFNEPDNVRGISHYIEHNLFNGSEALGDKVFFDEVYKLGAETNASTDFSKTDYYIESALLDDKTLEEEIKLHAGMLTSPKFLLEKLEKEKAIVNSEINMYMSEDEGIATTQTIKNLFNIKSSSLDLVAGSTDNITKLTRDDVVNYFNNNYYPANMTTVITGDVNPDDTMKLISKYFNAPNKATGERHFEKMTPLDKTVRQDIISQKTEGASFVSMGFVGPKNNDYKEKLLLRATNLLMGGLRSSKVSDIERKYGTSVAFGTERLSSKPDDYSLLSIVSSVSDDNVEPLLKDLYKVLGDVANNPPTEAEVKSIKSLMKRRQADMLERSDSLNFIIGSDFLNGNENNLKDFDKLVDSITAEDIVNTAKKYFDLNKTALTVVHPSSATKESVQANYNKTAISFTGANHKLPLDTSTVSEYTMPNNFDVTLQNSKSNNVVISMGMDKKDWTPKESATASVLNMILSDAGTKNKSVDDISKFYDEMGLDSSMSVNHYGLGCYAEFPYENTEKVLDVIKERIFEPNLTQEQFDDAVKKLKDIYSTSEVCPYDKFNAVMYKGSPAQFSSKDILASLDRLNLEDVKNFYNEILTTSQGYAVISAPFEKHPELKQQMFNSFGSYSPVQPKDVSLAKLYKPNEQIEVLTDVNKKNQAHIIEGFKFKQNGNIKDDVTISLLESILGGSTSSRLFRDLREKRHLAYTVGAHVAPHGDSGVFTLDIKTTTENHESGEKTFDNLQKSIVGFNENIERIKTEKISEEELNNAKKFMKSGFLTSAETTSGKNSMLKDSVLSLYGADYMNEMFKLIDEISVDDIYNCANYVFAGKPVYSVTATQDTLNANKEFLDSLKK